MRKLTSLLIAVVMIFSIPCMSVEARTVTQNGVAVDYTYADAFAQGVRDWWAQNDFYKTQPLTIFDEQIDPKTGKLTLSIIWGELGNINYDISYLRQKKSVQLGLIYQMKAMADDIVTMGNGTGWFPGGVDVIVMQSSYDGKQIWWTVYSSPDIYLFFDRGYEFDKEILKLYKK